jgi:hypothetical protein
MENIDVHVERYDPVLNSITAKFSCTLHNRTYQTDLYNFELHKINASTTEGYLRELAVIGTSILENEIRKDYFIESPISKDFSNLEGKKFSFNMNDIKPVVNTPDETSVPVVQQDSLEVAI